MIWLDEELGDELAVLSNREECVEKGDVACFTSVFDCEFDVGMLRVHVGEELLKLLP